MMTPNVTWVAACYGGFPRAKSPHYKPCSGSEKASGREKERVGSSAGRCAVETASCPPVCWWQGEGARGAPHWVEGCGGVLGALGPKSDKGQASHLSLSLRTKASPAHGPVLQAFPSGSSWPGSWFTLTGAPQSRRPEAAGFLT